MSTVSVVCSLKTNEERLIQQVQNFVELTTGRKLQRDECQPAGPNELLLKFDEGDTDHISRSVNFTGSFQHNVTIEVTTNQLPEGRRVEGPELLRHDPPVFYDVLVALEDIRTGCTKNMKIKKKVVGPDGRSLQLQEKILTLNIPPGCATGTKITFPREGDESPSLLTVPANVVFVIKDKPHAQFRRKGLDICYSAKISLRDALCGGSTVMVPTIDKQIPAVVLQIDVNEEITPSTTKRIAGHGLPNPNKPNSSGDLIVGFDIEFKRISPSVKALLRQALPV